MRPRLRAVLAGGAVLAATACGTASDPPSVTGSSEHYTARVAVQARGGSVDADITVTRRDGSPARLDGVAVAPTMTAMGHSTTPVTATSTGADTWRATGLDIPMGGVWALRLIFTAPSGTESLTVPIPLPGPI
jgi:hypothetical protein